VIYSSDYKYLIISD